MGGRPRMSPARAALAIAAFATTLAGCRGHGPDADRPEAARGFPKADRPVSSRKEAFAAAEPARESRNEAETVMNLAEVKPAMTVADVGAGRGYYTVELSKRVGDDGRVLAEDIDPKVIEQLGIRVQRDRLDQVSIRLGTPEDPRLPADSFDRVFLIHMYHEVREPYAFLWYMRPSLRAGGPGSPGGKVIVVDVDRASDQHGIPPALLFCEFSSVGFRLSRFVRKPELQGYYAEFEAIGPRPDPRAISPCRVAVSASG
jgi:ubiquinone/menaquinone biosynthesis C-methylase UbiE